MLNHAEPEAVSRYKDAQGRIWERTAVIGRAQCSQLKCGTAARWEITRAAHGLRRRELKCGPCWQGLREALGMLELAPIDPDAPHTV
jgi:hypothetical protein